MSEDQYPKILIVEDDDTNYLYLSLALETENLRITRVVNGHEAIDILVAKKEHFDLILMDIKLPGIDGFETTKEIRKHLPDLPIIAQTAYYIPNESKKFEKYKMNGALLKPFSIDDLLKQIYNNFNDIKKPSGKINQFL